MSSTSLRTRRTPEQRSAEILDAAIALARENGLTALSLRAIAQRVGVTTGLVSHYQPSMESLTARVFASIVSGEIDDVATMLGALSPTERAAQLFATLLDGSRHDVTLIWVEAWAIGRHNAALAEAIEEQMAAWHAMVLDVIEDGIREASFTTMDPGLAAWQILGMIDGLAAHAMVRGTDVTMFRDQLARASEVLLGAAAGSLSLPESVRITTR